MTSDRNMSSIEASDLVSDRDSQRTTGQRDKFSNSLEGRESSGVTSFSVYSVSEARDEVCCFFVSMAALRRTG